jgi:hypothetical protein
MSGDTEENRNQTGYYVVQDWNRAPSEYERTRLVPNKVLDFWPLKMGPTGCPETSVHNYHTTPLIAQKSADLIYTAAEARNHVY